jgi:prepilin-type N-terminal cleavage/methylation domain-containing protein
MQRSDDRGFTIVELLVVSMVFLLIAFGAASLYLSARRGLDYSSAEAFLQRQGTLIEERLTEELKSATSVQVTKCREISPASTPVMPANTSIVYSRYYPGRATPTEYWCIYEYQRSSASPFAQLWRCPLASLSADTCTGGTANAENLLPSVPSSAGGQRVEITKTTFCPTGVAPCAATGVTPAARAVDVWFEMNLYPPNSTNPNNRLLYNPRFFGFTVAYRN